MNALYEMFLFHHFPFLYQLDYSCETITQQLQAFPHIDREHHFHCLIGVHLPTIIARNLT